MTKTITKLGAAVALAVAGTAAQALPLSDYDSTVVNVYFGGATATDNVLENTALAITGGYCLPGTIDIYRGTNERVIFCRVDSTRVAGFPNSPGFAKVAFHKESQGGSSNGVNPLIDVAFGQAHILRWLDLDQLRVEVANSCGAGAAVGATGTLNGYQNHPSCTTLLTPVDTAGSTGANGRYDVNGGISDTEPALSYPAPTAPQIARLTSRAGLGILFGVPVSLNLYRALQIAQGKAQTDNAADIPSLTSEQIRGIWTSNIADWTSITDANGTALPSVAGVTPPTGGDTTIYICRRVGTSGTQASFESYWLNQRCATGVATFIDPNDGSTVDDVSWFTANPNNGNVNAGPSSSNVRSCLNIYGNSNGLWAIGVLSTEVTAQNMADGNLRMVAIDGAAPTLQNVANGAYDFWTENTLNRVATGFPGALPSGDLRLALLQHIENNLRLPTLLAQVNTPFQNRPWGDGGVLSIPNGTTINPNSSPASVTEMRTNPVNTGTRAALGTVNNCSPALSTSASPVLRDTQVLP
jgi:ABC-type phosphate transport system substrate-binding protein